MPNLYPIPKTFKVRSAEPELLIEYIVSPFGKLMLLLMVSPLIAIFIGHCLMMIYALKALLSFNFRQFIFICSYGYNSPISMLMFAGTFSGLSAITCYYVPRLILTTTELQAAQKAVVLAHMALGRSRQDSVSSDSIAYFYQYRLNDGVEGNS